MTTTPGMAYEPPRRRVRDPLGKWMRKRGWSYKTPRDGIRRRLYSLTIEHHPWWDWGHRLMILTGTDHGGNWSEPEPPTWWYVPVGTKRMWRTGYPRRTFKIVTDYELFRALSDGLNEDELYAWQAINVNQDGQLQLGHLFWGKGFYGLSGDEHVILRRYLRMARRHDWFGVRSWLYSQGLHGAVYLKKPRTCQATPPKGQGGYDHWFCGKPRRHDGMHRYNNYTWGEVGGEPIGTMYAPEEQRAS